MASGLPIPIKEFSKTLSSYLVNAAAGKNHIGISKLILLMKGVAVSGGVDSMALCTLLRQHRETKGWPKKVYAYTVDHGVRPESSTEANEVKKLVTAMGPCL